MLKQKSSKTLVSTLMGFLNKKAPSDFAESWDNVGLIIGNANDEITGIIISVNLGPEAIAVAEKQKANVIICHHPPIFKAALKLTAQSNPYVFSAIQKNISVIALHTNFDLASEELNRVLAKKLNANYLGALANSGSDSVPRSLELAKFVTFVPEKNLEEMRTALYAAGAGNIGQYSNCSFALRGEGTFLGGAGSVPTIGKRGQLEKVEECRLEVVFPLKSLVKTVEAARKAHPYEEMSYDIYPLIPPIKQIGYGFYADFPQKMTFKKVLEGVKQTYQLKEVVVSGPAFEDQNLQIKRIAFSPGSGSSFVGAAIAKGVDLYICGEVGYHQMLEARTKGLSLMVLGHSYSEIYFVETLANWIEEWISNAKLNLKSPNKIFEKIHATV